ncbi:hypothetical protein V5799_022660, partial [Amblyomma americanum]
MQQARALFRKRWNTTKREYFLPILAIVIPVALFFLYTSLDIQGAQDIKTLVYDVGSYAGSTNGFLSNGSLQLGDVDFVAAMTQQRVDVKKGVEDPDDFLLEIARHSLADYNGSYLFSYIKKKPSSGYSLLTTINVITGVMLSIVMAVVSLLAKFPPLGINDDAVQKSMGFLRLVPGFAVTWGFSNIHEIGGDAEKCSKLTPTLLSSYCPVSTIMGIEVCCQDCGNDTYCYIPHSAFSVDRWGSGREMLYLFFVGTVLFLLLAFFESNVYGIWYRIKSLSGGRLRG